MEPLSQGFADGEVSVDRHSQVTSQRRSWKWRRRTMQREDYGDVLIKVSYWLRILRLKTKGQAKSLKISFRSLNSQLVDMYTVSILSNLYTAQKEASNKNSIHNGSYRTNLLDSVADSKIFSRGLYKRLRHLSSLAARRQSLSLIHKHLMTQSQGQYGQNDLLIKQRSERIRSAKKEFMNQLMSLKRRTKNRTKTRCA